MKKSSAPCAAVAIQPPSIVAGIHTMEQTVNPVAAGVFLAQPPPTAVTLQQFLATLGLGGYETALAQFGAAELAHIVDLTAEDLHCLLYTSDAADE